MNKLYLLLQRLPLVANAHATPLFPILKRYAWSVPFVAALGLLSSGLEGIGIGLLIPLLSTLLTTGDLNPTGLPLGPLVATIVGLEPESRLVIITAVIFALIVLKAIVQTLNWTFIAWIDGRAAHDIRQALSEQLLKLGYPFYLEHEPSRLVTIVSIEAWRASDAVRLVFSIAASSAAIVVFSILLAVVSWQLFLLVAAGVAIIRIVQLLYSHRLRSISERVSAANRDLSQRMLLIIDAMRLIRISGQQDYENARFQRASEDVRKALLVLETNSARMAPALEVMHVALFIGVLLAAKAAGVSIAIIITFLVLVYRMQPHLMALNQARLGFASVRGSVREVEWLLDPTGKPGPPSGTIPFRGLDGPIIFEGVNFSYPNRPSAEPALTDVSFTIHKDRAIALIGQSGAGKSTIVNMLCRLLDPTKGRITVAGEDLRLIDPATWRARIGMAGQDIDLIDGSIADNIGYGAVGASLDDIKEASRLADADAFIRALPEGYHTPVGTRGMALSGGQRQRIGLARALIRKPDILILDEATNAVDGISERAIISLLADHSCYKTAIVISHRQSTLAHCEDGLVLEDGRVVENGPLKEMSFYKNMDSHRE